MKKKKVFFTVFMVLIPVMFLIISLIIISAIRHKFTSRSDYEKELVITGYSAADLRARTPYVMFRPVPGKGGINSLGFRSPEVAKIKKPNEFRIAIVGGSVPFNGYSDDSTIVGRLARILKNNDPTLKDKKVVYINGAIPSAVSGQELAQFIYHILPLQIDLLVVFDGYNDFFIPFNFDRRPGYPYDYIIEQYRYAKFMTDKKWWDVFVSLFDPSLMFGSCKKVVRDYYQELGIKQPDFSETLDQEFEIYFRNVSYMATIANGFGIKCAVFLQPYSPKHNKAGQSNGEWVLKLYAMAGEKYKELSKGNSPFKLYHSMVYMGFKMQDLFTDIAHFADEGNELIAQEMYAVMKKAGMVN